MPFVTNSVGLEADPRVRLATHLRDLLPGG
jgi:hypothetical protein